MVMILREASFSLKKIPLMEEILPTSSDIPPGK